MILILRMFCAFFLLSFQNILIFIATQQKNCVLVFICQYFYKQYFILQMSYFGPCKKRFIDKYSYLSTNVLGQGYSGVVYLGKHQETGNKSRNQGNLCAIKIIEKSILKYQAHKSMILCQIQFLKILKGSQNILTLHEVYNTKNNIYLVSQLCNTDLKQYLAAKKTIPQLEAIDIMKSIITGYRSIWKAKIVHRDLKPANILLQNEEVKIADFGFSMYEMDKKQYEKINVGSPYYMPPQVLGYNNYSYQSDIWALGIIFYEMLTGKTPWKAKTQKQLYKQLTKFDIADNFPPNITQNSKEFLLKSLALDPSNRMKPRDLTNLLFGSNQQDLTMDLRSSVRSETANSLQKTIRKVKILCNPQNHKNGKLSDKNEEDDKNSNDQIEDDIEIGVTNQDNVNGLANSRMKNQNNQERLDQVQQLPSPPKKKKNVERKTSLQVNYEPFANQKSYMLPNIQNIAKTVSTPEVKIERIQFKPESKIVAKQKQQNKQKKLPQQNKKVQYEVMKSFSKILRSQIHFCRYLFKLLTRVIDNIPNELNIVKIQFKQQMASLIFLKLKKIQNQKIADSQIMKQWLETKQWDKIKNVIKQYKIKYKSSLQQLKIPKQFDRELFKKLLRKGILQLYKRAYNAYIAEQQRQTKQTKTKIKRLPSQKSTQIQQDDESQIMKIKQEVIILDYFITLKQLFRLEEKYGWQGFEKKAKIQNILQSDPLKYIQQKHILAISEKLQTLKIL